MSTGKSFNNQNQPEMRSLAEVLKIEYSMADQS